MPTKFKVGDKVKLLLGVETGIVSAVSSNQIFVLLEGDIEIPVTPGDIVLCTAETDMANKAVKKIKVEKTHLNKIKKVKNQFIFDMHLSDIEVKRLELNSQNALDIQMNKLIYQLKVARDQKCKQLIVIHGVGDGVLKSAVIDFLKRMPYIKKISSADPFVYGQGATLVQFS